MKPLFQHTDADGFSMSVYRGADDYGRLSFLFNVCGPADADGWKSPVDVLVPSHLVQQLIESLIKGE